jgi:hypothetical protein
MWNILPPEAGPLAKMYSYPVTGPARMLDGEGPCRRSGGEPVERGREASDLRGELHCYPR